MPETPQPATSQWLSAFRQAPAWAILAYAIFEGMRLANAAMQIISTCTNAGAPHV